MSDDSGNGRVWFITGSSSGFGKAIAEEALARGERVVATARRPGTVADLVEAGGERVLPVALDVLDADQRRRVVDAAVEKFGRITCW
jgi:NAD(P)-dependent dehydrogenase (short-subunit alcohol dehydrogenase family)